MRNPKWNYYGETRCKIFDCYAVKKNLCCQDCYRKGNCKNACMNHPSRCNQAILPIDTESKPRLDSIEKKAKMVFQEKGSQWDEFDISRIIGGKGL